MAFEKGKGGRPKGAKNIRSFNAEMIAVRFNLDPFEVLMMIASGDWKGLGFEAPTKMSWTGAGIEFEEANVKLSDRLQAAKEATKYLYSTKQSVQVTTGDEGINIIIKDYTKKE